MTFCDERYPMVFKYPESMEWNTIVGLQVGNDDFFFNVGVEELDETNVAIVDILTEEIKDKEEAPTRISVSTIGENDVAIATFPGVRSQFEKERGLFKMKYWATTIIENYKITFVGFQNTDYYEQLLPTLEMVMGSVRSKYLSGDCS